MVGKFNYRIFLNRSRYLLIFWNFFSGFYLKAASIRGRLLLFFEAIAMIPVRTFSNSFDEKVFYYYRCLLERKNVEGGERKIKVKSDVAAVQGAM